MTLEEAGTRVLRDARRNDYTASMSDADVLADVRERISLDDVVDYEDDDTEAYRVYLAHHQNPTREQLYSLLRTVLSGYAVEHLTPHFRVWATRIMSGELS